MLKIIAMLYIAAVSPSNIVAIDEHTIYVCSDMPKICLNQSDDCIDSFQKIDLLTCYDCSSKNADREYCDEQIPFYYSEFIKTTFGYIDDNITVNMHEIVHSDRFSIDDYLAFLDVFSSDCAVHNEIAVCNDAIYLARYLTIFLRRRNAQILDKSTNKTINFGY
jgi:hypothetical protein